MKRLLCILLAMVFITPAACCAESIDLTGLSFDDLAILRERVTLALWASQDWQQVKVPQGIYKIGKDIPAGAWTMRPAADYFAFITIGNELKESNADIARNDRYAHAIIVSPKHKYYKEDQDMTEFSFTFEEGDYILIEESSVFFTPYIGADLGFR